MPKYDAFGREIGEDTLQGLGGSPSPAPAESAWETRTERDEATWQAAEQVEVARRQAAADAADAQAERTEDARQDAAGASRYTATPQAPDAQRTALAAQLSGVLSQAAAARASAGTPSLGVRKRSAGRGCLIAVVVLLAILGGLTAAVVGLVNSVDVKTSGTSGATKIIRRGHQAEARAEGPRRRLARPPGQLQRRTHPDPHQGRRAPDPPPRRPRPDRRPAAHPRRQAAQRAGQARRHARALRPGLRPRLRPGSTIPFARLNPAAPQRLARAGAERIGVPVATLQYVVPTNFNGRLMWAAYFTRGRYVLGDASGRFQRNIPDQPLQPAAVVAHAADLLQLAAAAGRSAKWGVGPMFSSASRPGASPPIHTTSRSASSRRSSAIFSSPK